MYKLNSELYQTSNIYNFIDESVNLLLSINSEINSKKEYWLFYCIKEDYWANWMSLYDYNIEMDVMGFSCIKRNTRHAIEAFLDLFNLYNDAKYIEVLKYCSKKRDCNIGNYRAYMHNHRFSIQSKVNIAKLYGGKFQNFLDITNECNSYVHPNVFTDLVSINSIQMKQETLRRLLLANLFVFDEAFKILLTKFNCGEYIQLSCIGCNNNCDICHNSIIEGTKDIINNRLLYEYIHQGYNFTTFY